MAGPILRAWTASPLGGSRPPIRQNECRIGGGLHVVSMRTAVDDVGTIASPRLRTHFDELIHPTTSLVVTTAA